MAKNDISGTITVELSRQDRALLRRIADYLDPPKIALAVVTELHPLVEDKPVPIQIPEGAGLGYESAESKATADRLLDELAGGIGIEAAARIGFAEVVAQLESLAPISPWPNAVARADEKRVELEPEKLLADFRPDDLG